MIITISGNAGSGKDEVAKIIKEKFGYDLYSMGDLRRESAKLHGMTLEEYNKLGEIEDWTDKEVDEQTNILGQTRDNLILVGRLGYYLIPQSIKVFLYVDEVVAARRIMNAGRQIEQYDSVEQAIQKIRERDLSDAKRYKKYYGIENHLDPANFDIAIDTTNIGPDEVATRIFHYIRQQHSKTI